MTPPWDWDLYIYLHLTDFYGKLVGKYTFNPWGIRLLFVRLVQKYNKAEAEKLISFMDAMGTPLKINMEHNHGCLEDHFPF